MKLPTLQGPWTALFVTTACALHLNVAQAQQTATIVPDHIAVISPVSLTGGGFESPAVASHQYGSIMGADWTFQLLQAPLNNPAATRGSGIANNASPTIVAATGSPEGSQAAFVHGVGRATQVRAFSPGTYRLRFDAAQRVRSGQPDTQTLRVQVGGKIIFEQKVSETGFVEYLSTPFRVTSTSNLTVKFSGRVLLGEHIALFDDVEVIEATNWNDNATWNSGQVPGISEGVYIPKYATVLMDGACEADFVEVNGALIADEQNCTIDTRWVLVETNAGLLQVGKEGSPFAFDFILTLTGAITDTPIIPGVASGTKALVVRKGGQLDLHGLEKKSWTKLASIKSSTAGSNDVITVDDHAGWAVNDEVLLVSTKWMKFRTLQYNTPRSVSRVVTAINGNNLTLGQSVDVSEYCVAPPLDYPITAHSQVSQSWTVDQRAEVGMLSHNVKVVGDVSSTTSKKGGHIMIAGMPNGRHGTARISGVELHRMGQVQEIGRYPMHWHMQVDNGLGQYFRDSSVHECYNRAITVHGTNYAKVERNVCFDTIGHAVFLEDGVEQNNEFRGNLVVFARRPVLTERMLLHDSHDHPKMPKVDAPQNQSPALFWISHPNNTFEGNVAAETIGCGYWFALHTAPSGQSAKSEWAAEFSGISAITASLGSFDGNVAHSCHVGIDLNDSIRDVPDTFPATPEDATDDVIWRNRGWEPSSQLIQVINDYKAFGCGLGIYSGTGTGNEYVDSVAFERSVLSNNGANIHMASAFTVTNSLIVHDNFEFLSPANQAGGRVFDPLPGTDQQRYQTGHALVIYDGPATLKLSHLAGFDAGSPVNNPVITDDFGAAQKHTNNIVDSLTFEGQGMPGNVFDDYTVAPNSFKGGEWGVSVLDVDGSLSRGILPGRSLISNHPMMRLIRTSNGTSPDVAAPGANAYLSTETFGHFQVYHYGVPTSPSSLMAGAGNVPEDSFTRLPNTALGFDGASFDCPVAGGSQIRQIPVIVSNIANQGTGFEYEVVIRDSLTQGAVNRIDLVVDDVQVNDVTRLKVTYEPDGTLWSPTAVYLNETGSSQLGTLSTISSGTGGTGDTRFTVTNGVMDLTMVNPQRKHRITIVW